MANKDERGSRKLADRWESTIYTVVRNGGSELRQEQSEVDKAVLVTKSEHTARWVAETIPLDEPPEREHTHPEPPQPPEDNKPVLDRVLEY